MYTSIITYGGLHTPMIKILFICHGNICRSPMAEYIMKKKIAENHLSDEILVSSAATSVEELGNPVYPPVKRLLNEHGISCDAHKARVMVKQDYRLYDLIIGMDSYNMRNMKLICGGDPDNKMHLLSEYGAFGKEVADPWYTRDFETAWKEISSGCEGLLWTLRKQKQDDR